MHRNNGRREPLMLGKKLKGANVELSKRRLERETEVRPSWVPQATLSLTSK